MICKKKKTIQKVAALLIFALVIGFVHNPVGKAAAQEQVVGQAVLIADDYNMGLEPNMSGGSAGTVYKGEVFDLYERIQMTNGKYCWYVRSHTLDIKGYVSERFLSITLGGQVSDTKVEGQEYDAELVNVTDYYNMGLNANLTGGTAGTIYPGEKFKIIRTEPSQIPAGYCYYVYTINAGLYGYVSPRYVNILPGSNNVLISADIPDGYYIIKIKSDPSKVIDVDGARMENGVNLHIWEEHGGDNQVFYFERQPDGTYKIIAKHSQLAVEVRNSSHKNEAEIAQWEYVDGYDCKLWYIIDCGNGYFKFINKESKMCMDIQGNGTDNGVRVQQYEDNGTDAQRFQLISVNGNEIRFGVVKAAGGLRVRQGRGTQYARLTVIPNNTRVEISEIESNWGKVTYAGYTGYISMDYVVLEGNNNASNNSNNNSSISLNVTDMKQKDPRWKSVLVGKSGKTIGDIGCCLTALSMAESYRKGSTITPDEMAGQLKFTSGGALYWPGNYSRYFDADYLQKIYDLLSQGKPVLVCGFSSSGVQHWVLVKGYNGEGLSASNFTINDPGSSSRTTLQDFFNTYSKYRCLAYYN